MSSSTADGAYNALIRRLPGLRRVSRRGLRRALLFAAAVVGLALLTVGIYAWREYQRLTSARYNFVSYTVPNAPQLVAGPGERVYRIDPTHSQVGYAVDEKLFGTTHRAHGTTNGIAGDIALDEANPSASRAGEIVVNVEELHSDNNLRDAKIRADNLDSHDYPLAKLNVTSVSGFPSSITEGRTYRFRLESQLTVKTTTAPVTWNVDAKVADGRLTAHATTHVKMSTFGIGPISISGLVSTSDDVALTMRLTALDPSKYTVPTTITPPKSAAHSGKSPSFRKVVMPALQANCASCHEAGQVGADHWQLTTAADAAKVSDGIGTTVGAGYMPPWPASKHGVPLAHSRALDRKTIDEIVAWSRAGGPLDVRPSTKIRPKGNPVGPPPRRDVVLRMPRAYAGSLSVPNDYRCFVLDPHFTQPTYVTGYDVTPDQRTEIHHVQIFHVDAAQVSAANALSGQDGKPGWSCYGSVSLPNAGSGRGRREAGGSQGNGAPSSQAGRRLPGFTGQAGLFAGWVPGQDPTRYSNHTGVLFQPGDALVFQVHYHYDAPPIPDQSTVALQVSPPTPAMKPIDIINPIAPVEIPCMPGETAPLCNRDAALADDANLYGGIGAAAEPGLLAICHKTQQELAANFHDGIASTTCEYKVPENGTIVSVFGHEHTLGKSFRLTLDPDTRRQKTLLDIPRWNFAWQMNYPLKRPIHVTQGQDIRMQCTWDRSLDPNRAPKYIVFAEGTEDEMCFGVYAMVPDNP